MKIGALFFKEATPWVIEVRRDNAEGELLAEGVISAATLKTYGRNSIPLKAKFAGFVNLYIKVRPEQKTTAEVRLQDISFEK